MPFDDDIPPEKEHPLVTYVASLALIAVGAGLLWGAWRLTVLAWAATSALASPGAPSGGLVGRGGWWLMWWLIAAAMALVGLTAIRFGVKFVRKALRALSERKMVE